jgi:UDP-N-acetylmuramoylalanine--D-glutamate ligase
MAVSLGLKGRKVVVVGANESGIALTKFLIKKGATVTLAGFEPADELAARLEAHLDLSKLTLEGGDPQAKTFDGAQLVVVTPGVPLDLKILDQVRTAGIPVVSELEFVAQSSEELLVAIGGTKGKATTAHVLAAILEASGRRAFSAARQPLAEHLNLARPAEIVIAPASPLQLEGISTFKPKVAILLNIHEDFASRYPNFESYLAANREILRNADEETIVVLNSEDPNLAVFAGQIKGRVLVFGSREIPEGFDGAWCSRNKLHLRVDGAAIVDFDLTNLRLRGPHNRENLMAAVLAASALGASREAIAQVISSVTTLPSRVEFVKRLNAVAFYNDSCATSVQSVIRTLHSFNEPLILIMGGKDKTADFAPLIPHVRHRVKNLILVGEAKEKVNRCLGDFTETFLVGTLEEGLLMAYQKSRSGDVVLLSPGCDAFDAYTSSEERGEHFRKLVLQLAQPRKAQYL